MKDEINKALSKRTPGKWRYIPGHYGRNHIVEQTETGNIVCLGKTFGKTENDFNLIANAPTYLEWSLKRIEELEEIDERNCQFTLNLRSEVERLKTDMQIAEETLRDLHQKIGQDLDINPSAKRVYLAAIEYAGNTILRQALKGGESI